MTRSISSTSGLHLHFVLTAVLALFSAGAVAQTSVNTYDIQHQGSVIGDDVLYSIGGGRAVSMSRAANMRSIGVGVGWNANLICGDMSITTTLQNQLNGISNGFQAIMSSVIQNATAAVASLPALIIQRADPGLYNLLTNGILQARLDYDRSKLTCRAMAERMADMAGGQLGWNQLAEGFALRDAVGSNDAVSAIEVAESNRGNNGVPWIGGSNAGGSGQQPVRVVGDVTRAGYNLLLDRGVTDTSAVDPGSCHGSLACDSCTKTVTTPGVGLTPLIQDEYEQKLTVLAELITGSRPTNTDNLHAASSASLPITRGVIEALRDEPDQDILARRLASEVALASVLEKALLLQRTLLTGRGEPNVAANELAEKAIARHSDILDREIFNLKTELEIRRELANNSPMAIIERHSTRSAGSRGIYEGDPVRDRLDQLQRPPSGSSP